MFMQRIFYQVYMHDPVTKGYYYKKDMKNLLAPNILDLLKILKRNLILFWIQRLKIVFLIKYLEFK